MLLTVTHKLLERNWVNDALLCDTNTYSWR